MHPLFAALEESSASLFFFLSFFLSLSLSLSLPLLSPSLAKIREAGEKRQWARCSPCASVRTPPAGRNPGRGSGSRLLIPPMPVGPGAGLQPLEEEERGRSTPRISFGGRTAGPGQSCDNTGTRKAGLCALLTLLLLLPPSHAGFPHQVWGGSGGGGRYPKAGYVPPAGWSTTQRERERERERERHRHRHRHRRGASPSRVTRPPSQQEAHLSIYPCAIPLLWRGHDTPD